MLLEVKAAGYCKGDRLILQSDKESQFRFDETRTPGSAMRPAQPKKAINPNNRFAKMFPVPHAIRENDIMKG